MQVEVNRAQEAFRSAFVARHEPNESLFEVVVFHVRAGGDRGKGKGKGGRLDGRAHVGHDVPEVAG